MFCVVLLMNLKVQNNSVQSSNDYKPNTITQNTFMWFLSKYSSILLATLQQELNGICIHSCSKNKFNNMLPQWGRILLMVKNPFAMKETGVPCLGWEEPLEKGMALRSSNLDWRIPWKEESGGLQSMGSQRVRHLWATNTIYNLIA